MKLKFMEHEEIRPRDQMASLYLDSIEDILPVFSVKSEMFLTGF